AGRHLPAAGDAAGPVPQACAHRLPGCGDGNRDPAPGPGPGARPPACPAAACRTHFPGNGVRRTHPGAGPAHGAVAGALPRRAGAGLARCGPLRPGPGAAYRLGRQPARLDRAGALRACAGVAGRARLPDPGRQPRGGPRRVAPSPAAQLRGAGRRRGWRWPGGDAAGPGAAAVSAAWPAPTAAGTDGIVPRLEELLALRHQATRAKLAGTGRIGLRGLAPSSLRGRGMEYAESREYVAGDDVRRMDWRLTARTGQAHTKLFQVERERLSLLVADTAPSLYFGTRVRFKSVQAARAGAVAVWAALQAGDRIAALRGGEPAIPPAAGMRGAMRVLESLVRWYARAPEDDAGLELALEHAQRLRRPGGRVFVLAEPIGAAQVPLGRWAALARHHEAHLVLLQDALEIRPPRRSLALMTGNGRLCLPLQRGQVRRHWDEVLARPSRTL